MEIVVPLFALSSLYLINNQNKKKDEGKPQDVRNHGVNATEFCMMEVSKRMKRDYDTDVNNKKAMLDVIAGRKVSSRYNGFNPIEKGGYYQDQNESEYEGFGQFFDD